MRPSCPLTFSPGVTSSDLVERGVVRGRDLFTFVTSAASHMMRTLQRPRKARPSKRQVNHRRFIYNQIHRKYAEIEAANQQLASAILAQSRPPPLPVAPADGLAPGALHLLEPCTPTDPQPPGPPRTPGTCRRTADRLGAGGTPLCGGAPMVGGAGAGAGPGSKGGALGPPVWGAPAALTPEEEEEEEECGGWSHRNEDAVSPPAPPEPRGCSWRSGGWLLSDDVIAWGAGPVVGRSHLGPEQEAQLGLEEEGFGLAWLGEGVPPSGGWGSRPVCPGLLWAGQGDASFVGVAQSFPAPQPARPHLPTLPSPPLEGEGLFDDIMGEGGHVGIPL